MIRRYATGAYLWHAIILVALIPAQLRKSGVMIRSTRFGVPSSVAALSAASQVWPAVGGRFGVPSSVAVLSAALQA